MKLGKIKHCRIDKPEKFKLADFDPAETFGLPTDIEQVRAILADGWKFSANDIAERGYWDDYMAAYEDMIRETSSDHAPWYVISADHKHVAWVIVSAVIVEAIEALKPSFPKIGGQALKDLKKAERALRAEGD
jgi:hypothetical protein